MLNVFVAITLWLTTMKDMKDIFLSIQKLLSDSTKELLTSLINKWSSVVYLCCFTFILLINRIENTSWHLCVDYIHFSTATRGWLQIQEFSKNNKSIWWQWIGYVEFKISSNVYFVTFKIVCYLYFLSVKHRNTRTFFFS